MFLHSTLVSGLNKIFFQWRVQGKGTNVTTEKEGERRWGKIRLEAINHMNSSEDLIKY